MNARRLAVALAVASCLAGGSARAQTSGFAVDRFEPAAKGSAWFTQDSLDLRGNLRAAGGIVVDYAYKPLVIYDTNGSERSAIVQDQLFLHAGWSFTIL